MNELEQLKDECLRKDGTPRKTCDREKLIRLVELQAAKPQGPVIETAPDDTNKLRKEYDKLVKKLFIVGDEVKLKKGATAKDMARFLALRDMLRQPEPKPERIETKVLPDGIEVKVSPGPPVNLEGKNDLGWEVLARIMPQGGKVKVKGYTAFRISRGTDKPEHVELRLSTSNPNRKVTEKKKPQFDIKI